MQERLNKAFKPGDAEAPAEAAPTAQAPTEETPPPEQEVSAGSPFIVSRDEVTPAAIKAANAAAARAASAGTTVERAMAAQNAAQSGAASLMEPVSLPVGHSGAYFQPGIKVGAAAFPGAPDQPITAAKLDIPASETLETDASEPPLTAPQKTQPTEDELLGDLHQDDGEPHEPVSKPRRRKNFLQRKYQIWPTHFWPHSWRRAWKRRAEEREARRAEREEETETQPQPAE